MPQSLPGGTDQRQPQSHDESALRLKRRMQLELQLSGRQAKAVAIDLEVDPAKLSRWLSDHSPDVIPAHRLADWSRWVGGGLFAWLQRDQPEVGAAVHDEEEVGALAVMLATSSGATLAQLIQDLEDQHWSTTERRRALPGLRKLKAIVDSLVLQAENEVAS